MLKADGTNESEQQNVLRWEKKIKCTSFPIFPLIVPFFIEAMSSASSCGVCFISLIVSVSFFRYAAISPIVQFAASFISAPFLIAASKKSAT